MAIDSNNDNSKYTGVEDKNYSNISNNNLDFSLAEVILKSPLGKDILRNMEINNESLNNLTRIEQQTFEKVSKTLVEIKIQTVSAENTNSILSSLSKDFSKFTDFFKQKSTIVDAEDDSDNQKLPQKQTKELANKNVATPDKQLPVVSRLIHDSSIESKPKELTNENVALPTPSDDNISDKKSPVLSKPVNNAVAETKDEDNRKKNTPNHNAVVETKDEDIRKKNNANQTGSVEIKDEDIRKKNNAKYTGVEDKLAKDVKGNTNINFAKTSLNNKIVTTLLHHLGLTKRHALKNEDFYKNFENLLKTQTLNFKGKDGISGSATLEEFIKTNLYTNITDDDSEEVKQEKAITALHNMLNGSFEEFFKDYKFASQEELEQKKKEFKENRKLLTAFYGKTLKDAATQSEQTLEQIKKQTLFGETLYKDLLDEDGNVIYEKDKDGNDVAVKSDVIEFNKKTIFGAENIIDSGRLAAQDPEAYAKNVYAALKGQFGMPIQHIVSDVSASLSIVKALATPIINNIKESKAYRKMRTAVIKAKDKAKEKISELIDKVKNTDIFKKTKDLFSKFTNKTGNSNLFKNAKAKVSGLFSSVKKFFTGNESNSQQSKDNTLNNQLSTLPGSVEPNKKDNAPDKQLLALPGSVSNVETDNTTNIVKAGTPADFTGLFKNESTIVNAEDLEIIDDNDNQKSPQKQSPVVSRLVHDSLGDNALDKQLPALSGNNTLEINKDNKANDVVDDTQKIESEQEKLSIDKEQLSVLKEILAVLSNKSSTDKEKNKEKSKEQPEQQEQPQEQSSSVFDMLKNFLKNPKGTRFRVLKGGFKAAMSGKLIRYISLLRKRSSKTGKAINKAGTGITSIGSKAKNLVKPALTTTKAPLALPGPTLPGPKALSSSNKAGANVINKGSGLLSKFVNKFGGKTLAKAGGKSLLKKIPGVSLLAGTAFGAGRLLKGDWKGALGEVASGALGTIPGIGTAASLAIDGALMAKDLNDEVKASEQMARDINGEVKDSKQNKQSPAEENSNKPSSTNNTETLSVQEKDKTNIVNNEDPKNPDVGQKKPLSFLDKIKSLSAKALPTISPIGSFIKDAILNPPQVEQPSVDVDETSETEQLAGDQTLNIIVNKLTELIELQKINNEFASRPKVATSFIETNLPDMYNI